MANRTLYRPREIIQFCTQTAERARDLGGWLPVRYAAVREAEGLYSAERARDIAAEFRYQYPGLLTVFDAFRGKAASTLDRDDLEYLCLELITQEIPARDTGDWLDHSAPRD